jgi:hypothetical protein
LRTDLARKREKLLGLYYRDAIGSDFFAQEEGRLRRQLSDIDAEEASVKEIEAQAEEAGDRYERAAELLMTLDIDLIWQEATENERRVLLTELLDAVTVFPDHLEVRAVATPPLVVLLEEVGLSAGVAERSCRRRDLNPHAP